MTKDKRQSPAGSALVGATATKDSSTSFSQCTTSHDSSMISAITLDSALRSCDKLQLRFDPKLESLKEQKWAANPDLGEHDEDRRFSMILPLPLQRNLNRFSDVTEETDTTLCEMPQRLPSLDSFYRSSSSSSFSQIFRTSACSSDYRSSKSFLGPASFFLEEEVLPFHNDGIEEGEEGNDEESRENLPLKSRVKAK